MTAKQYLSACRADTIPEGDSGLWYVRKTRLAGPFPTRDAKGKAHLLPAGIFTSLFRWTDATLHLGQGDLVMHDFPYELKKHLVFITRAYGRVLITGLGLGCVVRGCLANPKVESVTVIEQSPDVLKLVAPHMPQDRLKIVEAEAIEWTRKNADGFDCAWHDLWSDESKEPKRIDDKLQYQHMQLICNCAGKVALQGAWEFPKYFRKRVADMGVI